MKLGTESGQEQGAQALAPEGLGRTREQGLGQLLFLPVQHSSLFHSRHLFFIWGLALPMRVNPPTVTLGLSWAHDPGLPNETTASIK